MGFFEAFQAAATRAKQAIDDDRKKIGGMHAGGMARQGLAELRQAVSFDGTIAQPTVYGIFGTTTPGEVAAARQDDGASIDSTNEVAEATIESSPLEMQQRQAAASGSQRQRDGLGRE